MIEALKKYRIFKIIILLFLLLIIPPELYAGGQNEEELLSQVEVLIEDRHYNEAITLLTRIAKDDPSRFDDVNTLLQKVLLAQKEYNLKYNQLLNTYETDLEESYVLIKELEDMNPDANERTRQSLVRARETAGFVFNRTRWEEIMDSALGQLNQGQIWESILTYRTGFDLSLDIFQSMGHDSRFLELVALEKDKVNLFLDRFNEMNTLLETHRNDETEAFNTGNSELYGPAFNLLYKDFRELSEILMVMESSADIFNRLEEEIRLSRGDEKEVHHLIYLELLISGRDDSEIREGIYGAIDRLWNQAVAELTEHTEKLILAGEAAAGEAVDAGEWDSAVSEYSRVIDLAVLDRKAVSLWGGRLRPDSDGGVTSGDLALADIWLARGNSTKYKSLSAESRLDYIALRQRLEQLNSRAGEISESVQGQPVRDEYIFEGQEIAAQKARWSEEVILLGDIRSEWYLPETEELITGMIMIFTALENDVYDSELALIGRMGSLDRNILEERLRAIQYSFDQGVELLQGLPAQIADGDEIQEILAAYPDLALEAFGTLESPVSVLKNDITREADKLSGEASGFLNSQTLQALVERDRQMLDQIRALESGIDTNIQTANNEIFTAQRFRQEGDRRLNESRQLIERGEYPGAKERLTAATLRYDESLLHQEDSGLRSIRDIDIPELFEEIQREENRLVISQVRQYLTEGQNLYSQADFAVANTVFLRAQNRWADTNVEANPEVEYWLELTRTALSVTTGREIAQTDPLFTEMIQYLNQATEDYNSGITYISQNLSDDADISFNQAERNLLYVQQFFPFNKDARVLTIKIAQQRDPQGFRDLFSKDFNDARSLIRSNPQQAYVELKDLEVIDSRYPGLQAAIIEAEYATGIKVRPPDPRKIARSRELFADASRIVNSNNITEFQIALAYLDEAISLNPDYQEAIRLKDSVAVAMGGTSTEVLSSADQRKFQEAVTEFTAGNYLKAQIIVDILLNNPDNRNNTRLLELKERIASVR